MRAVHFLTAAILATAATPSRGALENPVAPASEPAITRPSLERFDEVVGDQVYAQTILPHDFSLVAQLLEHGRQTNQPRDYTRSVMRMFSNLLKGADYVNAAAVAAFLKQLPGLIDHQFSFARPAQTTGGEEPSVLKCDASEYFQHCVNDHLYHQFSTKFDLFKREPDAFLATLATQITDMAEGQIETEQLRQTVVRFLENGLDKLIWSPRDGEKTWRSAKQLASLCAALMDARIIDDINDLIDLYWSIVRRYCYFLELAGAELPVSFYERVRSDITEASPILLQHEEQEEFIEPRGAVLMRALLAGEAQRRARDAQVAATKPRTPEPAVTVQENLAPPTAANKRSARRRNRRPSKRTRT